MTEPTAGTDDALARAEGTIRSARPSLLLSALVALVGAGVGFGVANGATIKGRFGIAAIGAVLAVTFLWRFMASRAATSATDRYYVGFAQARGWIYGPKTPLPPVSPFLTGGTSQRSGRGFSLTVAGHRAELAEHVRVDGSGKSEQATPWVVLLVHATTTRAVGLRIRPRGDRHLAGGSLREIDLESTELSQRFVVEAPPGLDQAQVMELMTPSFITAFLDLATAPCYLGEYLEIGVGFILLASRGTIRLEDGHFLDATIPAVTPLLDRLLAVDQAQPA